VDPRRERAQEVAANQAGRISQGQLRAVGIPRSTIDDWRRGRVLVRELPRVYTFGPPASSDLGPMWAAVLYAGPGASLTGAAGAWRRGLIAERPTRIEVSTPRRVRSIDRIVVRARRPPARELVGGLPVAPLGEVMLDLAASAQPKLVRKALARLDYRYELAPEPLLAACRSGRYGSGELRAAAHEYDPRLAMTNGELEDNYLIVVCEGCGVPKPDRVDMWIDGVECDAVYLEARLIIQLDGRAAHHSPAQKLTDHANDLLLRSRGWTVLRYSWELVHQQARAVADEIVRVLALVR
jgi:hypothetical protein